MSKYNNMKSIPIDSLSGRQLKKAIFQWSEGNPVLEQLLFMFYNRGIKTNGCHYGYGSYISINYDYNKREEISRLINIALEVEETQILILPDGGNPFSGPDFYKTLIAFSIYSEDPNVDTAFFRLLLSSLQNSYKSKQIDVSSIFDLIEFLTGKYSDLDVRIFHSKENGYEFGLTGLIYSNEKVSILNNLLCPLGFQFTQDDRKVSRCWNYKLNDPMEFSKKLKEISKNIINNYSLDIPTENDENISLNVLANLKRKKSIDQTGNLIQFERWLNEERKKMNKRQKQKVKSKTL